MPSTPSRQRVRLVAGDSPQRTKAQALRLIGPSLYALWLPGHRWIKIGWTTNVHNRLRTIAHRHNDTPAVLAVIPGSTLEDEQSIHDQLPDTARAHGREYYRPSREVLAIVNQLRASINLPALA